MIIMRKDAIVITADSTEQTDIVEVMVYNPIILYVLSVWA